MKNINACILQAVLAFVFVLAMSSVVSADTVIACWNYNTQPTGTGYTTGEGDQNPFADTGIMAGVAQQTHFGSLNSWGYNDGDTDAGSGGKDPDPITPDSADVRYRFQMSSTESLTGLQWHVSTEGYKDIFVELGIYTRTALSGQDDDFRFDYSTDGGATWTNNPVTYGGNKTWSTYNLSSLVGADDNPDFTFRFVNIDLSSDVMLTTDWGQVRGNPVPIPTAAWLLASGLIGLVGLRRCFR